MQISRHWRLNNWRYRLQTHRPYGKESEGHAVSATDLTGEGIKEPEKRLIGAMLLPLYQDYVVLQPDVFKFEGIGIYAGWDSDPAVAGRYGLPAGGQQGVETSYGTIFRELGEENSGFNLDIINKQPLFQVSTYPFVVNQLGYSRLTGQIDKLNQITVTVKGIRLDDKPHLLEQFVHTGGFLWSLADIADQLPNLTDPNYSHTNIRPQVIVAAAFATSRLSKEDCISLNRYTVYTGYRYAVNNDIPVFDGAMLADGYVNPRLSKEQLDYLGI